MQLFWHPDFCAGDPGCLFEIESDWSAARAVVRYCTQHQVLKDSGLTDAEIFAAVLQTSRVKEAARWAAHVALALPEDDPGLPYTVSKNGDITIQLGVDGATKAAILPSIDAATALIAKPIGTSNVTVV
jgi:hypothetical protein